MGEGGGREGRRGGKEGGGRGMEKGWKTEGTEPAREGFVWHGSIQTAGGAISHNFEGHHWLGCIHLLQYPRTV